ncbi:MAG TPA: cupin domain-containing protein, partial [bacterium]
MKVFDLKTIASHSYEERDKNVFYRQNAFKMRIIELPAGGEMPECRMESFVIFYVVSGEAEVCVDQKTIRLAEGQCLITEPATLSMKAES